MKNVVIRFWTKDSGNAVSHKGGLSAEQVQELKTLEEGDRLVIWKNETRDEYSANFTLKVFKKKSEETSVLD